MENLCTALGYNLERKGRGKKKRARKWEIKITSSLVWNLDRKKDQGEEGKGILCVAKLKKEIGNFLLCSYKYRHYLHGHCYPNLYFFISLFFFPLNKSFIMILLYNGGPEAMRGIHIPLFSILLKVKTTYWGFGERKQLNFSFCLPL